MLGRIGMVCGLYLKGPWVGRRLGLLSTGEKGQRVLGGNGCIQTMGQHQHKIFSVKAKHSPNLRTVCLYVMRLGERRYKVPM